MEGEVLRPPRRSLRRATASLAAWAEKLAFPEAEGAHAQYQRVILNREVRRFLTELGPSDLRAAEISGANHSDLGWKSHTGLDYPEYDVCGDLGAGLYDVVVCEQVLEHVVDPFLAARNLASICEPGGHVVVSTPFLIRVHELPKYGMRDYWRFTPRGLRRVLEQAGLEIVHVSSWGNRTAVLSNLSKWSRYRRGFDLDNDPDLPVQVWAFARAPGSRTTPS